MLRKCVFSPLMLLALCIYPAPNTAIVADKNVQGCGAVGDCLSSPIDCQEICGCDSILEMTISEEEMPKEPCHYSAYYYNETTKECVLDLKYLMQMLITRYNMQDDKYIEDGMAKKIQSEADKVFKGIIISVLIFVTCAVLAALSACIYCIRMNYTDRTLKNDVDALANKLHRDQQLKKSIVKSPRTPKEESCNVMVESAGIYVV